MKIINLKTENVKRLSAVEITPTGDVIVIGGKNGAGKSSVLDSIAYALGGKDAAPSQPIRKGQDHAEVVVDLDTIIVTRRFTDKGSYLTVTNKEGMKYASPQKMLDDLVGKLSFDPLAFSRMRPADQAQQIRGLIGLDTSELDAKREEVYASRTLINRDAKNLEAKLSGLTKHDDAPDAEADISSLVKQRQEAAERSAKRMEVTRRQNSVADDVSTLEAELAIITKNLKDARGVLEQLNKEQEKAILACNRDDIAAIDEQIKNSDAINRKVRDNASHAELSASLKKLASQSNQLTKDIDAIDKEKKLMLSGAEYPVDGLGFTESGTVVFNGIPFDQASAAEQLRVSVAMGLAMNPELRVLLIRDGSLLDDDSLGMVAKMAADKDAQVWIERVGDGKEVSVVIEDGTVRAKDAVLV